MNKSFWSCKHTWQRSAKNTAVCLLGCAIGDNAVIVAFQNQSTVHWPLLGILVLAMVAGLASSITLETLLLLKQLPVGKALRTAFGMSMISMLMMEGAANLASIVFAGGNRLALSWWGVVPAWILGYLAAWVYNYFKLKRYGKACH